MSTVFLIGNGFDLNCGMKTSYTHVYNSYCNLLETDSELIRKFKKEISSDFTCWSDFEEGMAKYASTFSNEADFLQCLWNFKKYLIYYLKNQEASFWNRLQDRAIYFKLSEEIKRSVNFFYTGLSNNLDYEISRIADDKKQYICFNYTNVFNKLRSIDYSFSQDDYVAIHGTLDKDVVMGVDNADQVNTQFPKTNSFSRAFIKPVFNDEFDSIRLYRAKRFIETSNIICTYGLSLGNTDLSWRNLILDTLKENPEAHLFYYSYEMIKKSDLLKEEQMIYEEQEKNDLSKKWHLEDNTDVLKRIHIPCGKHLFDINQIIEKHIPQKEENN